MVEKVEMEERVEAEEEEEEKEEEERWRGLIRLTSIMPAAIRA